MTLQDLPPLDDFADYLAKNAPRKMLAYKASAKSQERLNFLLAKNKQTELTSEENTEVASYMMMEHLVRLAKARAIQRLNFKTQ